MREFTDFHQQAPMPEATVAAYRGRVPDALLELWQRYGTGSCVADYVRIIDPALYEPALADCTGRTVGSSSESIPVAVSGLGDLVVWEPGSGFTMLKFRDHAVRGMGTKVSTVFGLLALDGTEELDDHWDWQLFPAAVEAHGPLAFDESFIFVPLPSLGGARRAENLAPRPTIEAIRMMVDVQGTIGH